MKCSKCNQEEASVRIIVVKGGQKIEMQLCELCAKQEKSLATGEVFKDQFSLESIKSEIEESLKGYMGDPVSADTLAGIAKDLQEAINQLGLSPADVEALIPSKACPQCGITWDEVKKTSKFGCPYDYEYFAEEFAPTMKRLHLGATIHVGKVPKNVHVSVDRQVMVLEQELEAAVKEEKYEKAAELRDQIKGLKETK